MARRGFIIAIERYGQMADGLAQELPGTHEGALAFRNWLMDEQGVDAANILFCTEDESLEGRTSGATRNDIIRALDRLITTGQDETEQLYFYYSGHGFCFTDVDQIRLADVLVAADYADRLSGSGTCIAIDEVQRWLRVGLGPEDQFYFLDCCRNRVGAAEIKVSEIGPFSKASNGFPAVYTLYSATEGEQAAVQSGFTGVLIDGLEGKGRAKVWYGEGMAVLFRSVKMYVRATLKAQPVDAREEGSNDGVIRVLKPTPRHRFEVVVENAGACDSFHITARDSRGRVAVDEDFTGPSYTVSDVPDEYTVTVTTPGFAVVPVDPMPADLYEDRRVRFQKTDVPREPTDTIVRATIEGPASGRVVIHDLQRDETLGAEEVDALSPGLYTLDVLDDRDIRVSARGIEVTRGEPVVIDLAQLEQSPLRDALLERIPGARGAGAVEFSADLGLTPDQGIDLWLAVIGASRILAGSRDEDLSRLEALPLAAFDEEAPGSAPLYVLAGFETPSTRLAVGVDRDGDGLRGLAQHSELPGLYELPVHELASGGHLLTLRIDDAIPLTLPIATLTNRATLVTVHHTAERGLGIQQFVFPLPHLAEMLPHPERIAYGEPTLSVVRRLVELQRQFADSRRLTDIMESWELSSLLYVKWFEPIGAILAAYELARRGAHQHNLDIAVRNLRMHFPELPDTEAIARRAGERWSIPSTPPLVLDGLMELDRMPGMLPLPAEDLDYRGPWTLWRRPDLT